MLARSDWTRGSSLDKARRRVRTLLILRQAISSRRGGLTKKVVTSDQTKKRRRKRIGTRKAVEATSSPMARPSRGRRM